MCLWNEISSGLDCNEISLDLLSVDYINIKSNLILTSHAPFFLLVRLYNNFNELIFFFAIIFAFSNIACYISMLIKLVKFRILRQWGI